jgi:single-stranded-DNA-specific exonuclease
LRRGTSTAQEAREFLAPDAARLHDPFLLRGAGEAAERLVWAARSKRRIVVFGDYDVDGVTAAAQLKAALMRAGADAVAFLPHRIRDGYGLKPATVRRVLSELHPELLVTVDCGVTATEGIACARAAGVEVIVTDHHIVPEELPEGAVVVNPKQPGCAYPCKDLSAAGIALKIAEAVGRVSGRPLSRESLLRAACLGTIADLVPLTGENRIIAAAGLSALATARSPGLRALLAQSGVEPGRPPDADEVAYRVAPRLNAAGRLDTAELALALFEEREPEQAAAIARRLSVRNAERQAIERQVAAQARERVERAAGGGGGALIVEADPGWHRGVLGIAAARLAREYHRPVLLFALEGEMAYGSGRSVPSISLFDTMRSLTKFFLDFGGHDQAVGGTLPVARLEEFREAAREHFAAAVAVEKLVPVAEAEAELPLEQITPELAAALAQLEPHGMGNPRPLLLCGSARGVAQLSPLGEDGARGALRGSDGPLPFIAWRGRQALEPLFSGEESFALHYRLERDRFRGGTRLEVIEARRSDGVSG